MYFYNLFEALANGKDNDGDDAFEPNGVDEPTDFPPGTKQKVEVLHDRCDKGLELWHPDDASNFEKSELTPIHLKAYSRRKTTLLGW